MLYLSDILSEKREFHEYLTVMYSSIHSETDLTAEKKILKRIVSEFISFATSCDLIT